MKLLHIDSSILGEGSVSRLLTADIVAQWQRRIPDIAVTYRDLSALPVPHLTGAVAAAQTGLAAADPAFAQDLALGTAVLEEFLAADVVVIGAPMYNFGVPSQLKAWIDRLAVRGKTFRYGANGPEGLAGGKKVIVASSRGGFYGPQSPAADFDHQESYLRSVFAFLGITDISFVRAEGVNVSPEQKVAAIASAREHIAAAA
jgi:FMN-dependent NADH-azoreductase